MSNQWKQQEEKPKKQKSDQVALIEKGTDGKLRFFMASQSTAERLENLKYSSPGKLSSYLDAVFRQEGEQEIDPQEARLRKFMAVLNRTQCFNCEDSGYHMVDMEAPNGKTYSFAYSCECPKGFNADSTVRDLVNQGLYHLSCKMGGETGEYCPLVAKQDKCRGFKCPKFVV